MTCARPDQRKAPRRAFAAGASFHVYIVNSRAHIQEQGITGPGGCQPPFPVNMKNKFAQPSARRARPAKDDSPPPAQPGGGTPPPHAPPVASPARRVERAARLIRSRGIPSPAQPRTIHRHPTSPGEGYPRRMPRRYHRLPSGSDARLASNARGGSLRPPAQPGDDSPPPDRPGRGTPPPHAPPVASPARRVGRAARLIRSQGIPSPARPGDDSPPPDRSGGGTPSPHAPPVASPARRVGRAARLIRSRGIPAPTRPTGGRFTATRPARGRDALAACPAGGITCPAGRTRGMPFTQEGQPCARPCRPIGARGGMGLSSLRKARRPSRAGLPRIRIYEIL